VGVSRSKQRREQVPALPVEDEKRMIDVVLVVGTFLLPVGRICGRIEVQKHLLWSTFFSSLSQVEFEDCLGYWVARAPVGRVLKARDGRLAGEVLSCGNSQEAASATTYSTFGCPHERARATEFEFDPLSRTDQS
jgi:hypothetical protein